MTTVERLQANGIRRLGTPKSGFRYRTASGGRASSADAFRIRTLRIPPAWKDVAIAASPRAAVQAVGRDAAGRWQYRYHESAVARREARKARRLLHFAQALPQLRRAIARDLARPGLPRERVLAGVLRILSNCFLRPGSDAYAKENGSFGISTLRRRHVAVRGDRLTFDFPGKSGKQQRRELEDRRVARLVRQLLAMPGRDVFKFVAEDGSVVDVKNRHINDYIKEVMGERFSAKDFRTWAGTLICACALARAGSDDGETRAARRRKMLAAIRETADHLGNTVAVCRASYINRSVLTGYEKGRVIQRHFRQIQDLLGRRAAGLHPSEKALLAMLKKDAVAAA